MNEKFVLNMNTDGKGRTLEDIVPDNGKRTRIKVDAIHAALTHDKFIKQWDSKVSEAVGKPKGSFIDVIQKRARSWYLNHKNECQPNDWFFSQDALEFFEEVVGKDVLEVIRDSSENEGID